MSQIQARFAENLKKLRIEKGLTQGECARTAGLSLGFLQNIENGKRWASPETIAALANTLHIKESVFFQEALPAAVQFEPLDMLKVLGAALGVHIEDQHLKKMKVNRAYSFYAPFFSSCPHEVSELMLELCQHKDWKWDEFKNALSEIKTSLSGAVSP